LKISPSRISRSTPARSSTTICSALEIKQTPGAEDLSMKDPLISECPNYT